MMRVFVKQLPYLPMKDIPVEPSVLHRRRMAARGAALDVMMAREMGTARADMVVPVCMTLQYAMVRDLLMRAVAAKRLGAPCSA